MGQYSYTQPSQSDDPFCNSEDSDEGEIDDLIRRDQAEMEDLIRRDQAEIEASRDQAEIEAASSGPVQYPPQPEVEFGFPQTCYCGAKPIIETCTSRKDPGRRFFTCARRDDGECHVWKWWDVALMEEMTARDRHVLQLAQKVDSLTHISDYDIDKKFVRLEELVCDIAKEKRSTMSFEYFVAAVVVVLVSICFKFMFK